LQKNEDRPGYKKTKVGWIPKAWDNLKLGEIFVLTSGKPKPNDMSGNDTLIPVFGGNGIMGYSPNWNNTDDNLIVGRVGEKCGCVHKYRGRCWITDNALYVTHYKLPTDYSYIYYALTQMRLNRYKKKAGQPLVSQKLIYDLRAGIPPLPEQEAIAGVLECWDKAIRNYEKKIEKKRNIKKGLMQRLLSPPRAGQAGMRLPGFSGEWKEVRLGEVCSMKSGETITSKSIYDKAEYRCFGGNGLRGFTTTFTHDGAFVLIGRQGALCGNVHLVSGRFYASEHAIVATPSAGTNPSWLAEALGFMNLNRHTESSAQPGLSVSKVLRMRITAPPPSEQDAIASVLCADHAELAALERKLTALKEQKRFLLNNLVTGTIRLPQFVGAGKTAGTNGDSV